MQSTWRVDRVIMTKHSTIAEITRVEWWKQNPDYTLLFDDESYEGDMPDEFIEALPGEDVAECLVMGTGTMTIDLSAEELLDPGDNLVLTIAQA
jgi:hypothetical protein